MQPDNDDLILMAIRQAARARGCELNADTVDEYLKAFSGIDARLIREAFSKVFRTQDSIRTMPSPKAIITAVRGISAGRRPALADPKMGPEDYDFGSLFLPSFTRFLRKEITRADCYSAIVKAAREAGVLGRIQRQLDENLGSWRVDPHASRGTSMGALHQ